MNIRNKRPTANRRAKHDESVHTAKAEGPKAAWQLVDDQLDDALRQTFPAGDALSIVQNTRCA